MGRFADTAHRVLSRKMQRDQMDQQAEDADANRALQYASMGQQELARGMNNQDALRRVKEQAAAQQAEATIQANARMHGDDQQLEGIRVKSAAELEQERRKGLNQLAVEDTRGGYGLRRQGMVNTQKQEDTRITDAFNRDELAARGLWNQRDNARAERNARTLAGAAGKDPVVTNRLKVREYALKLIAEAGQPGKSGHNVKEREKPAYNQAKTLQEERGENMLKGTYLDEFMSQGMPPEEADRAADEAVMRYIEQRNRGAPPPPVGFPGIDVDN